MWTLLVANGLFPLQERLKGHTTLAVRRAMEASQWQSPEQIAALQMQRLRALLADVATGVPYYRDLFAQLRFDPHAVRQVSDLQALPFLDKTKIRAHTEALKNRQAKGLARFNTGGSSGELTRSAC